MWRRLLANFWFRTAALLAVDLVLIGFVVCIWLVTTLPRIPNDPKALSGQAGVNIYADSGELLYTFNRRIKQARLDEISPWFIKAVVATEDEEFYRHRGISLKGMAGAALDNLLHLRKFRGGSTITQQIVKNLFLSREKTYLRKIKEVLLARQLEAMFQRW